MLALLAALLLIVVDLDASTLTKSANSIVAGPTRGVGRCQ